MDRYAYANNSPLRYTDPSGHFSVDEIKKFLKNTYGNKWEKFWKAWESDKLFWGMLLDAAVGDELHAPTSSLGEGAFTACDGGPFCFQSDNGVGLEQYQGQGPYILERNGLPIHTSPLEYPGATTTTSYTGGLPIWAQPQFDYSQGYPVATGMIRVVTYGSPKPSPDWTVFKAQNIVDVLIAGATQLITKPRWVPVLGYAILGLDALSYINNGPMRQEWELEVSIVPQGPYIPPPQVLTDPFSIPGSP